MTPEQIKTIKKEYSLLSNECKKYYDNKDYELLSITRIKIAVFIETIEKVFNVDFYSDKNFNTIQ